MAKVSSRKRDGVHVGWEARWRDPAGRQRKKLFTKKSDAERYLTGIEHAKLVGTYVDPAAGRITFNAWSSTWLRGQSHLKPSTRARYEGIMIHHLTPRWGTVHLGDVTYADITAWITDLSTSGLAGSTVRYVHRVMSLILELAMKEGRLSRNPAAGVRLPRAAKPEKRFLTHQQVALLADAANNHRLAVLVLAYCGLRWGELAALKVRRVDLMRRRLEVVEAATEVRGHVIWDTPKDHRQRSVPIPRFLADQLAVHLVGKGPDDLVFTSAKGAVLRNLNFRRDVFDPAARSAGLTGLTPHELRHTAASLAVSSGANVLTVQRMLGHASAAMTLDVYSGLFDDDLDAVAERLDAAARGSVVPQMCPEGSVIQLR